MEFESGQVVQVISGNHRGLLFVVQKQVEFIVLVYSMDGDKTIETHFHVDYLKPIGMAALVLPDKHKN